MRRTTRILAAALAAGVLAGAPRGAAAPRPVDETVPAAPDGTVRVANASGSVALEGHDAAEVRVTGTAGEKVERVSVTTRDGDVTIEVVLPRNVRGSGGDANLVVRAPKGADVEAETVSASIDASGLAGSLALESVSGDVRVRNAKGGAEISTVSGAIRLADVAGSVEVESVSGAVEIRGGDGSIEAETTSGSIRVEGGPLDQVECTTVSGGIRVAGTPRKGRKPAQIRVENFSGPVVLELPADVGATVKVETFSGDIDNEFGGRATRSGFGPGASLDETWGDGVTRISVSTFSGAVSLRKGAKAE